METKRIHAITLQIDRPLLNPVREPGCAARAAVMALTEDGTVPMPTEAIAFSCTTRHSSGQATVAGIDKQGIITPLAGGVADITADCLSDGKTLTAGARLVVRPFYHNYHQSLVMKLFLGMEDHRDASAEDRDLSVIMTFEQVLETVVQLDTLTRGLNKIIYLVGWQKGGHDHGYPALDEVNPLLKRTCDASPVESLRWLMREAARWHTSVSLHINLNDAYRSSHLFQEYDRLGLIAREADGSYLTYPAYEPMYAVSLAREWQSGLTQKRLDGLLAMLPELVDSHTLHIDNWVAKNHRTGGPVDPYHQVTIAEDEAAIRAVFLYLRERGLDATSEGSSHGRNDPMIGLQPMTWWDLPFDPMEIPASLYCGGRTSRLDGDPRFGESMQGESLFLDAAAGRPLTLERFVDEFCLYTLPWVFLNRLDRLDFDGMTVRYSEQVTADCQKGVVRIFQGETLIRHGNTVFVPAVWREQREIIAYSLRDTWFTTALPNGWDDVVAVDFYQLTATGLRQRRSAVRLRPDKQLEVPLNGRQPTIIVPAGTHPETLPAISDDLVGSGGMF